MHSSVLCHTQGHNKIGRAHITLQGGGEAFEQPWPDQISTVLTAAFLATEDEICEKNDARGSGTTASVVYIKVINNCCMLVNIIVGTRLFECTSL